MGWICRLQSCRIYLGLVQPDMRILIVMLLAMEFMQACSSKPAATEEVKQEASEEVTPEGLRLIESNDCLTCHHTQNTLVGPSYSAIASKYDTSEETIALLSDKIIKGGAGVWGDMPMNAHPSLSEEEARKIVEYILSVRPIKKY